MTLARPGPRAAALRRYREDTAAITSNERLVVQLYERLLGDVDAAAAAIDAGRPGDAHPRLINAQQIVEALELALDLDRWPEGRHLAELYRYVERLLVAANTTKDPHPLRECRALLGPLASAWQQAWAATTPRAG